MVHHRFIRHVLFWIGVIVFFFIGFFTQPEAYPFVPGPFLIDLFGASLPTYLFYTYLLVYGLLPLVYEGAYGWFAVGLLMLNILASLLYSTLGYVQQFFLHWLAGDLPRFTDTINFTKPFLKPVFLESNLVGGLMAGLELFEHWRQKQQESQRLEREKLTQELELLKLQLNPDFLFSSLDELARLIRQQSGQAPELILKLANLLRYVLYESQAERVPLAREIDMIRDYVFLQKAIRSNFLETSFTFRGNPDHQLTTPLSLFALVETLFRELPVEFVEPTWMSMDLTATDAQLSLKVMHELGYWPDYDTKSLSRLTKLQQQLLFYYPGNHSLKVCQEEQLTIITLIISFPANSLEPIPH